MRRAVVPAKLDPLNEFAELTLERGICCSEVFNATRSRAFPEAWLSRPAARSISRIDFSSARIDASKSGSCKRSAIISWRRSQLSEITQRLQNPRAQFACAHWRDRAVKDAQQTGVACSADSTSSRFACVAESSMT